MDNDQVHPIFKGILNQMAGEVQQDEFEAVVDSFLRAYRRLNDVILDSPNPEIMHERTVRAGVMISQFSDKLIQELHAKRQRS